MIETTLTMNSKTGCPYCDDARAFLIANAIPYTEVKHDDTAERQTMYDRLRLVDKARTVPQIVLNVEDEDYLIGGARELMMCGVQSLFGGVAVSLQPAMSVVVEGDIAGMAMAEEGHACCE